MESVKKSELLKALNGVSVGLSKEETLEQSDCFIFQKDKIITFNEEIMAVGKSPIELTCAVIAQDLLKILGKIPDDEIQVGIVDSDLVVKGKRKKAGVRCYDEIQLPFNIVPQPDKWKKFSKDVQTAIIQATQCCGTNVAHFLTTMIHITPQYVESCDNYRLFRKQVETPFKKSILIPAKSYQAISNLGLKKVSITNEWVHFKTKEGNIYSLLASYEKYHDGLDRLLDIGDAVAVEFPEKLKEVILRTEVMKADNDIKVCLTSDKLILESRKDTGWYQETQKIQYKGAEMEFFINPQFFIGLLEWTNLVQVNTTSHRIKIQHDNLEFLSSLVRKSDNE